MTQVRRGPVPVFRLQIVCLDHGQACLAGHRGGDMLGETNLLHGLEFQDVAGRPQITGWRVFTVTAMDNGQLVLCPCQGEPDRDGAGASLQSGPET